MSALLCNCLRTAARTLAVRCDASTSRLLHSTSLRAAAARQVPATREGMQTPAEFLSKIGRSMDQHESKFPDWASLWQKGTEGLKEAGISAPKERKYILRQMENYRQGRAIRPIAAKPKKQFRGRGPRVQKGVRVR